jgi:hypothetical protein
LSVHELLVGWLPMAVLTITILWCAAMAWGRRAPRLFQLPILRIPTVQHLLFLAFVVPSLVGDGRFHAISGLVFVSLLVAAFAVLPYPVSVRLAGVGATAAAGVLWAGWTNHLTADIFAVALILAVLNLTSQISRSFWVWSAFGILNVGYDIYTTYIVDTQSGAARDAVEHASPTMLVLGSELGSLDVAVPGAVIMTAAAVALRHRRMVLLYGGLIGYLTGFALCEMVLLLSHRGVAAMMTLIPATMAGILLPAWRTGLLTQLSAPPPQTAHRAPATNPAMSAPPERTDTAPGRSSTNQSAPAARHDTPGCRPAATLTAGGEGVRP